MSIKQFKKTNKKITSTKWLKTSAQGISPRLAAIWRQFKMERFRDSRNLRLKFLFFIIYSLTLTLHDFGSADSGEPK